MSLTDRTAPRWLAPTRRALAARSVRACGSDDTGSGGVNANGSGETAPAAASASALTTRRHRRPRPRRIRSSADAALLTPERSRGRLRALGPDGDWPYSAELVRRVPACEPFADVVFGGGAEHAPSATVTLQRREDSWLYTYVVVFPTSEEAAAMLSAVEVAGVRRLLVAVMELLRSAADGHHRGATTSRPSHPRLTFVADDYVAGRWRARSWSTAPSPVTAASACSPVGKSGGPGPFAAAEHFDTDERIEITQTGIDKLGR